MLVSENVHAYGFFGIIREFGWRKVVILEQDENLFTEVWTWITCRTCDEARRWVGKDSTFELDLVVWEQGQYACHCILWVEPNTRQIDSSGHELWFMYMCEQQKLMVQPFFACAVCCMPHWSYIYMSALWYMCRPPRHSRLYCEIKALTMKQGALKLKMVLLALDQCHLQL